MYINNRLPNAYDQLQDCKAIWFDILEPRQLDEYPPLKLIFVLYDLFY